MNCGVHKHAQKMGWLNKRGGRIQTWHKRWFVLTGDMLFYYKCPQDSRPTGTIPLAGNNVCRHQDDMRQPNSYKFEIVAGSGKNYITTTHDSYMISAETAEEANAWVASIKRALHEPYGGGMFGRGLEDTMRVEARLGGAYIPILVHRCVKFIIEHGLEEIGIFRLPGQTSRIQSLKDQYDQGSQLDISLNEDVHTVASLLKLYLRELPDPLIPFSQFDNAVKAIKVFDQDQEEGNEKIKQILNGLPKVNYNLLKYICRFLYTVSEHSEKNKMNCVNLATVFSPNIMSSKSKDPQHLIESSNVSANFVRVLIRWQQDLFPLTADEKPPKRLSIVAPVDFNDLQTFSKNDKKVGGSLFLKTTSEPDHLQTRARVGSVPAKLMMIPTIDQDKRRRGKTSSKLLSKLDSPHHRTRNKYFSSYGSNLRTGMDSSSGRVSFVMLGGALSPTSNDDQQHSIFGDNDQQKRRSIIEDDDDSSSPELFHVSSTERENSLLRSTDTVSPDLLINSITKELESFEKQSRILKSQLTKKKKESRLWKSRYEQERRARLAAEERIATLQALVDQTFQQFALDDSEDDEFDDDSVSETSPLQNPSPVFENGFMSEISSSQQLSPDSPFRERAAVPLIRHIRAQSSQ